MTKSVSIASALIVALTGCATSSADIRSTYISPLQYNTYDCDQISAEMSRIQVRVSELGGRIDSAASNDKAIVAVGAIIFWPALFALGGNKEREAEFARLKGELEAAQQASIAKKCMLPKANQSTDQNPKTEAKSTT